MTHPSSSRRDALRRIGTGAAVLSAQVLLPKVGAAAAPSKTATIPRRKLGKTGVEVSIVGLGGYHLGAAKDEKEALRIVHAAIDAGIDFFDSAWEYHDGKSEEWLGRALASGKRDKAFVMTKVCTHGRDKRVAMKQLEESLKRLKTDHVDLWQVHEVIYDSDPALHYAKDGVLEALTAAKKQGKVRFVGFTGHKHPDLHLAMLDRGYPFETVQLPLNPFDAQFRSFEQKVLPRANEKGLGVIGMKPLCGGGEAIKKGVLEPEESLRYALSLPVAVTVTGIDSYAILEQDLAIARGFTPMSPAEMNALRDKVKAHAADGRFELYKTSMKYDGKPGREQHGFPPASELGG